MEIINPMPTILPIIHISSFIIHLGLEIYRVRITQTFSYLKVFLYNVIFYCPKNYQIIGLILL